MEQQQQDAIQRIMESAERLGVEIDEHDARRWLSAMEAGPADEDIVIDEQQGIFGHHVAMLDFSPADLAYFREVGELVGFADRPGQVETALALSGSAAQSRIQTYPGDCDYFERVNIRAESRERACAILAEVLRDKALSRLTGETYRLTEVKFGAYPTDVMRGDQLCRAGSPISWRPNEIEAGCIEAAGTDGAPVQLTWEQAAADPGWCKLDWIVIDPVRGRLSAASNMLDVTWEAPDGSITPLDNYLDGYFQEIYLEAESIPIFSKLVKHMTGDALAEYVDALEREVGKYVKPPHANYGKAAKRMYNIFRLTGRYAEAAFLRELFDEPAALLYQIRALIRAIDEADAPGSAISREELVEQVDELILETIGVLDGPKEKEIVRYLLRMRDGLDEPDDDDVVSEQVEAARDEVLNLVNNFFYEKMVALPAIKSYIDQFTD